MDFGDKQLRANERDLIFLPQGISYDFQRQVIKNIFLSCSLGQVFLGTPAPCCKGAETKRRDVPPTAQMRFQRVPHAGFVSEDSSR